MCSGQAFRWRAESETSWIGLDGANRYRVEIGDNDYRVETEATPEAFTSLFRLDEDHEAIRLQIIERAPELEPYVSRAPGLRLMRPSDPVESLISFACTPNNNLPRILKMVDALSSHGQSGAFPSLETVAILSEDELRAKGFGYRARTVPNVARQALLRGGERWLTDLADGQYKPAWEALKSLDGIGPKLADCIALYALHKTEAVPVDTHLWQAATRVYFPEWKGKSLTLPRYLTIGDLFRDKFGELAGWAQQYLFFDNLTAIRRDRESLPQRR